MLRWSRALALLQNTVFSFSMRVCGQREDAEDTMQEVLLKSVPHLPKFDSPQALVVWLYKVAKNRCLMSRRRSKFAPNPDLSLEELMPDRKELEQLGNAGSINPEAFAIRREEAGRLREAIQRLPPQYRIVLVLRDTEGLTDEEVAEITGLRSGTVRVRLHRARLFVRKELMKGLKPRSGKAAVASRASSQEELHPTSRTCRRPGARKRGVPFLTERETVKMFLRGFLCFLVGRRRGLPGATRQSTPILWAVCGRFGQESRSFKQQRQFHARYANRAEPYKHWRLRISLIWRVGT
jgi:RNA polymerase sigma-70 factor (ECF subfamily)